MNAANIPSLVSLFVDRGVSVNLRTTKDEVAGITPLDSFNNKYNTRNGNHFMLAADIIRAAGGKCLSSCLTVNGVRDITLAPVSFSPAKTAATVAASTAITAGNLYTVRAASGLGNRFNYRLASTSPAGLASSFRVVSVDVNSALLSLNSDLAAQDFSVFIEATDRPSGDKATFRYVLITPGPFLANASVLVLTAYTGPVASIANVPSSGGWTIVSGGNNFAVGADGVLSLTATITVVSTLRADIVIVDGLSSITLGYILKVVGDCSFFSGCQPFVNYDGAAPGALGNPGRAAWAAINAPLALSLIAAGADGNEEFSLVTGTITYAFDSPILAATRYARPAVVSVLLNAGADVNATGAVFDDGNDIVYANIGVLDYVVRNTANSNIPSLVSLFVDRGVSVNLRTSGNDVALITPLDRFNIRHAASNDNNYRLAADIIRAAGGKCLSSCLTVNGVRDITLASVSFSPSAVTLAPILSSGRLYTVQAASGLGDSFNYRLVSAWVTDGDHTSDISSIFGVAPIDNNRGVLSLKSDLGYGQSISIIVEVTDLPSGDKATVWYDLTIPPRPFLVNVSTAVLTEYTGVVASVVNWPTVGGFRIVSGGGNFAVGRSGALRLTAIIDVSTAFTVGIVVNNNNLSPLITLGYTLTVAPCSFILGCQPHADFVGGTTRAIDNLSRSLWQKLSAPLALSVIAAGADVNEMVNLYYDFIYDGFRYGLGSSDSPLLAAARFSAPDVAAVLLNAGAFVNVEGVSVASIGPSSVQGTVHINSGVLHHVVRNTVNITNIPPLVSLFLAHGADVNRRVSIVRVVDRRERPGGLFETPLDKFNIIRLNGDRHILLAAEMIRAAGGKCFVTCRTVNGVRDITLASVSFSPMAVTVAASTAANIHTVRVASGWGTRFSYRVVSVSTSLSASFSSVDLLSSFSLISVDVNSARLSLNSDLRTGPEHTVNVYVEATDNNSSSDKATLRHALVISPRPYFVNVSVAVLTLYTGAVASVANAPSSFYFQVIHGSEFFSIESDGVLRFKRAIGLPGRYLASVAVFEFASSTILTLGYTLKVVGDCSFFSGCQPFVNYDGAAPGAFGNPGRAAWAAINAPLALSLIAAGADGNEEFSLVTGTITYAFDSPILAATRYARPAVVSVLLNAGADVNATGAVFDDGNDIVYANIGVLDYVVRNTANSNIPSLVSLFVDRGVSVNLRTSGNDVALITPLDRFNIRHAASNDNNYRLAADIIRAAGGKCLFSCLTVNGVRDITLASVSFSPSAVTITLAPILSSGHLYTVQAASGLGDSFNYRLVSAWVTDGDHTSDISSIFDVAPIDNNRGVLSFYSDKLGRATFYFLIEAIDNNSSGDKATLRIRARRDF